MLRKLLSGAIQTAFSMLAARCAGRLRDSLSRSGSTSDMSKTIIGLHGFAQVGKDTAGEYLVKKHDFVRVSFADAVRESLFALNPVVVINPDEARLVDNLMGVVRVRPLVAKVGWERAKKVKEVRELLQRMGTEVGRDIFGYNCWIDIAHRKAILYDKIVFTDVRFENEARFVKSLGGKVVRVNREGVGSVNGHASDRGLEDSMIDAEIYNNSTILAMLEQVEDLLIENQVREIDQECVASV
jgi:hypothetical protein